MNDGNRVEDEAAELLRQFSFTVNECRAYIALLRNSPATGYELSSKSGVPRSAIYGVLKRLEATGAVNAVLGKPTRYVPLDPGRLVKSLDKRHSVALSRLRDSLEQLAGNAPDSMTWTVQGYSGMLEQARELIATAETCVHGSIWKREAEELSQDLSAAGRQGIEVVLFSFTPIPTGLGSVMSYGIPEEDLGQHWDHKIIMVSDHRRALIGGAEVGDGCRSVITDEATLVEMAISNLVLDITLFGQRRGVDTSRTVKALTAHLAPIDDWLQGNDQKT